MPKPMKKKRSKAERDVHRDGGETFKTMRAEVDAHQLEHGDEVVERPCIVCSVEAGMARYK
jgi:hypothetical protein